MGFAVEKEGARARNGSSRRPQYRAAPRRAAALRLAAARRGATAPALLQAKSMADVPPAAAHGGDAEAG
jgi:hypothetical protein